MAGDGEEEKKSSDTQSEASTGALTSESAGDTDGDFSSSESPRSCSSSAMAQPSRRQGHAKRPDLWRAPRKPRVEDPRTTLVFKQIPGQARRQELCELLDAEGFHGSYNFVYVPVNFKAMACFGYAFVNFTGHCEAEHARCLFNSMNWSFGGEEKDLDVAWSDPHQGLDVHVERFRNSPVMHRIVPDEYKPILLQDGVRIDFPPPTGKVVPPRELRRRTA